MTSIVIRRAKASDIGPISRLVGAAIVSTKENPTATNGLIDYKLPTLERYLSRTASPHFFVARDTAQENKVVGMIDAYDSEQLTHFFPNDDYIAKVGEEFGQALPFVYINTVTVAPEAGHKGLGKLLVEKVEASLADNQRVLLTSIVVKPVFNAYSDRLFSKCGFHLASMQKHEASGLTFGAYKKSFFLH